MATSNTRLGWRNGVYQFLWLGFHTCAAYFIAATIPIIANEVCRGLALQQVSTSRVMDCLFHHLVTFSIVPASICGGVINFKLRHRVACLAWLIPGILLVVQIATFQTSIFHDRAGSATHHFFDGDVATPDYRSYRDVFTNTSNDIVREADQIRFTVPFYVGLGYGFASVIGVLPCARRAR